MRQPAAVHPQAMVVELLHAEAGARKVTCTKTLQAHCGLGLARAKAITDALLEKKYPTVSLPSAAAARSPVVALAASGVVSTPEFVRLSELAVEFGILQNR